VPFGAAFALEFSHLFLVNDLARLAELRCGVLLGRHTRSLAPPRQQDDDRECKERSNGWRAAIPVPFSLNNVTHLPVRCRPTEACVDC
jgi:hypothetical protein